LRNVAITSRELLVLLSGIDVGHTKVRRWYDREGAA
jgi:hypothetical protein